ncbi:hypothetical protein BZB76_2546 [Actinomadura pelletieri DSM 43383]|uniref:DUF1444 family protein n=1 Tax=Actinomadura pelletieri DSM 43383 TaxID=1120940 RepID=A0A495QUK0_9ACTN|nr:DUF1444 domain-containing protein [Actinomadura pelletieri]RKS77169.1 hypothetical protein BZB76_2546 [Actinomadura pelletieri DSM 43383]
MTETRSSLIVPLMRARVPAEIQLEFPLPPDEEPIRDPFAADLYVTYALEIADESVPSGRRHEQVARRHCDELGVPPDELRRRAVLNLRDLRPGLGLNWYPDVRAVTVSLGGGDGTAAARRTASRGTLESGLLLDDGFLEKLAQDVEGDLVVAVPARDVFVASGTGHPDGVDKLRWTVAQVWAGDRADRGDTGVPADPAWDVPAGSLLTHDLLVRRGGVWDVLPS